MEIIRTKILSKRQESGVNELWNNEYPVKLKNRFPILLEGVVNFNHYLIEDAGGNVLAWAVDFEKGNELRFSVIVSSGHQKLGLGGLLINTLKLENNLFYGWVIDHNNDVKSNGESYKTPISFYLKHGFKILQDIRIDTEMINAVKVVWNAEKI